MEIEISSEVKNKRLNMLVAITVLLLSVNMAIYKVKDDNIVQAMQLAKADAVDTWSEYQAKKIKLHLTENTLRQAEMLGESGAIKPDVLHKESALLQGEITRYKSELQQLQQRAKKFEAQYDALNYHDDQFDMSDAALSIAIAVAAVAVLTDVWFLLYFSWAAGAAGIVFGLAGFFGWQLHPDWLAALLS
ncbi:MAG: DUF4337 domain-containing protein [Gammaproteobacteria bacterium]